jgi:hypothetical protein
MFCSNLILISVEKFFAVRSKKKINQVKHDYHGSVDSLGLNIDVLDNRQASLFTGFINVFFKYYIHYTGCIIQNAANRSSVIYCLNLMNKVQ